MLRKKLLVAALVAVISVSLAAYAWAVCEGSRANDKQEAHPGVIKFKAVVNETKSLDVFVCVDISDGVTKEEAELIAGTTFIQVKGEYVTHRLDTLTFDDTKIDAHYTWGYDENDMGHVFHINADLTALQITVNHCF